MWPGCVFPSIRFDTADGRTVSLRFQDPAPPRHVGACRRGRSGPHDGEVGHAASSVAACCGYAGNSWGGGNAFVWIVLVNLRGVARKGLVSTPKGARKTAPFLVSGVTER